jgi:hypothetical protein
MYPFKYFAYFKCVIYEHLRSIFSIGLHSSAESGKILEISGTKMATALTF